MRRWRRRVGSSLAISWLGIFGGVGAGKGVKEGPIQGLAVEYENLEKRLQFLLCAHCPLCANFVAVTVMYVVDVAAVATFTPFDYS